MRQYESKQVEAVMKAAREIALSVDYDCVQTQHVLVALLKGDNKSAARGIAAAIRLPIRKVIAMCLEEREFSALPPEDKEVVVNSSAKTKAVTLAAQARAGEAGHTKVTTGHYLIACMEVEGIAQKILTKAGVKLENALKALAEQPGVDGE